MQLLRDNIHVSPMSDAAGCELLDERDGKIYEFGEIERYLLEQFQSPYQLDEVIANCNERFDEKLDEQDIKEFFGLLEDWGLLRDSNGSHCDVEEFSAEDEEGFSTSGSQPESIQKQALRQPNRWHLCNPQRLFDFLNKVLFPIRKLIWLTPLIFAFGATTVMSNLDAFLADFSDSQSIFGLFGRILLATVSINLLSQISRGLVARHFKLATPSLGIMLVFGLLPRFNVQVTTEGQLSREVRLWLAAILPIIGLLFFSFAAVLWASARLSGSSLATIGVELAFVSAFSFVVMANPFLPGNGSNLLSAWLDVPNLRSRSQRAMASLFIRQPDVIMRHSGKNRMAFAVFGLVSFIVLIAIVGFVTFLVFSSLENQFQGAGVSLFLLIVAYVIWSIRRQKKGRSPQNEGVEKHTPYKGEGHIQSGDSLINRIKGDSESWSRRLKRVVLLLIIIIVMLLPYRYETGGSAEVFPIVKVSVSTETSGIIDQVFVNGGEWVEAGGKLARMSHYRQLKDVAVSGATIQAKKFEIQQLLTTPSAEQVELAKAVLESARLQFKYDREELERLTPLYRKGVITLEDYEAAKRDSDLRQLDMQEAKLSLDALLAQINPNQIEALKADVEKLEYEASYYKEELNNTYIISPIEGRVIGENLEFKEHSYIGTGEVFVEVENTRTVSVRIAVPESDISDAKQGSVVKLKLWAYPEKIFSGKVDVVEPATASEESQYGRVIYITSHIDNPDGLLISGLTGHAKITGDETVLVLAFSRAFMRFLRIEVWSWLP